MDIQGNMGKVGKYLEKQGIIKKYRFGGYSLQRKLVASYGILSEFLKGFKIRISASVILPTQIQRPIHTLNIQKIYLKTIHCHF